MTVTIGSKFEVVFLSFLTLLLGACTSEIASDPALEQTTSESTGTTNEMVPTTGTEVPEVSSSDGSGTTSSTGGVDESTGESSTTGPSEPECGDGIVEGSEQCDDGHAANMLEGACLPNCVVATCGDGFIQTGVEECEPGDVKEVEYGGCLPVTCKWGPRCGDGHVDVPHEVCDPGDPNGQDDALVSCDAGCRFEGRIVFLTSNEYSGNLGGAAGADQKCRDLAATFDKNHADNYVAWLSDVGLPASGRISELGVPYVLRSGVQVAEDLLDLLVHGPSPGITLTEKYESFEYVQVWTGTGGAGEVYQDEMKGELNPCNHWTSDSGADSAAIGMNWWPPMTEAFSQWQKEHHWTSKGQETCEHKRRLYCFEN